MALSAGVVWEVRPSAGSNTACSGGFDNTVSSPGTDYSQQNAAQFSGTAGTAVGTTTFSDSGHAFTSADVGNVIQITSGSGFTAGFYTILSETAGTATLDRSPGTGTAAHWYLGGAIATIQELITGPIAVAQNTIYIKASGTITLTSGIDLSAAGFPDQCSFIGYTSTRTDGGQVTITTTTNSVTLFILASNNIVFQNISFTNTAGTSSYGLYSSSNSPQVITFINCAFSGFTRAIYVACYYLKLFNCSFTSCTDTLATIWFEGLGGASFSAFVYGCYIHGNSSSAGIYLGAAGTCSTLTCVSSVFQSNTYGIYNSVDGNPGSGGSIHIECINCAFVSNSSDGIRNYGGGTNYAQVVDLINCIFYNNGGYGINQKVLSVLCKGYANAYYNNTNGARNDYPTFATDVTLTADPFTNDAGGVFTLNTTAGGGAACKAAGFQSTLLG